MEVHKSYVRYLQGGGQASWTQFQGGEILLKTLFIGHAYNPGYDRGARTFGKNVYTLDSMPVEGDDEVANDMRSRHFQIDFENPNLLQLAYHHYGTLELFDQVVFDYSTLKFWMDRKTLVNLLYLVKPGGVLYLVDADGAPGGLENSYPPTMTQMEFLTSSKEIRESWYAIKKQERLAALESLFNEYRHVELTYVTEVSELDYRLQVMLGKSPYREISPVLVVYKKRAQYMSNDVDTEPE